MTTTPTIPVPPALPASVESPRLAEGYRTPEHGASRTDALSAGLDPHWRLVASADSPERLRSRGRAQGRWSFTAHLLAAAGAERWAVVVMWDSDWFQKDRHPVMVQALDGAAVEDTLPGLVRRFATGDRLPVCLPLRDFEAQWPPTARWAVLAMLLERPFAGRDAEQMLVDLTFGVGAVAHHRTKVKAEVAKDIAVTSVVDRFVALREQARGVGFVREGWVTYRHESMVRDAAQDHWDETTQSMLPGLAAAERAVWRGFFGDLLDDLTLPDPLPGE